MKKFLAAALASVMLVGGAALAAADGELNICSPNSDGLLSIIPVFEEQTGIKVNVESIGTGDCMKRIESEIAQEYSTFDLMYGGSLANYVANAGLFQDYVSEQDQYLMDAYKNTRGYCTNYTIDGSVLLVNTDMLKELGVEVNGYADLLQPELVGKIASADPASSSSAFCQLTNMLLAMGGYEDDAAWKYVEDLFVGQQVAITSGSSAVYKGVYNGEYAVGLTYEDPCVTLIKDGATNIACLQPFACLPNHVTGKGMMKAIRERYPKANIVAIDYDPGASNVNQLNRIKLMMATAHKNLREESAESDEIA